MYEITVDLVYNPGQKSPNLALDLLSVLWFIRGGRSMVIFAPISQLDFKGLRFGYLAQWALSLFRRKGPPEAVRIIFSNGIGEFRRPGIEYWPNARNLQDNI